MTTNRYYCDHCSKGFSVVNTHELRQPDPCCPWCGTKILVLVHRETWDRDRRHRT